MRQITTIAVLVLSCVCVRAYGSVNPIEDQETLARLGAVQHQKGSKLTAEPSKGVRLAPMMFLPYLAYYREGFLRSDWTPPDDYIIFGKTPLNPPAFFNLCRPGILHFSTCWPKSKHL